MSGGGFLRERDLMRRLGVKSRVTIWRWLDSGYLPPPRALGPTGNINVWPSDEIDQWIFGRPKSILARDCQPWLRANRCLPPTVCRVRIPTEVAGDSGMISSTVPI